MDLTFPTFNRISCVKILVIRFEKGKRELHVEDIGVSI